MELIKIKKLLNSFHKNVSQFAIPECFIPPGGLHDEEFLELYYLVPRKNKIKIAEIGCWTGMVTVVLGTIAKQLNGRVYSIDHFEGCENLILSAKFYNIKRILKSNIKFFELENTVKVIEATSAKASKLFKDNYFDFIFIDANHDYEFIKEDLNVWYPKVKKKGIISGHDFNNIEHPDVVKAVMELFPNARKTQDRIWYATKQ